MTTGGVGSVATLTGEDTWTDVIGPAGGSGLPALVAVNTVITGAAIVTAQTRVAGSSDAWQDIVDTAGGSNGGTISSTDPGAAIGTIGSGTVGRGAERNITIDPTGPITMKVVGTMSVADASLFCYVGERALYLS